MARSRKLDIVIAGDASGASRAFGQVEKRSSNVANKLKSFSKGASLALGGVAAGAIVMGKGFVDAAIESRKVTAQTEAVIKSMGGASNITAKGVAKLSTSLSMQTGIDDELIQSGENVLLTFGKVRNETGKGNDIFNQATRAALDMSVALGTDLKGANIQVGKALNDPIKGITALSRAGVSFTEEQKEQVKALVESGDQLGAQKIILSELTKQFKGSAKSQATVGDKLKVAWGNIQEQLGEKLLPIVEKVASWFSEKLPGAMATAVRIIEPIGRKIGEFFKALFSGHTQDEGTPIERFALTLRETVLPVVQKLWGFLMDHKEIIVGVLTAIFAVWVAGAAASAAATIAATWPILAIIAVIAALVAGVIYAYKHWGWFKSAVDAVARFMRDKLWPAIKSVGNWIKTTLIPIIGSLVRWFRDHLGPIIGAVGRFFTEKLWPAAKKVGAWIRDTLVPVLQRLGEKFSGLMNTVGHVWGRITSIIKAAVDKIVSLIKKVSGPISTVVGAVGKIAGATGDNLPFFDNGGVVPGPRGAPRLVMAHGGETFVPTHKSGYALSGGTLIVNNDFTGAVIATDADVERLVVDAMNRALGRGARIRGLTA